MTEQVEPFPSDRDETASFNVEVPIDCQHVPTRRSRTDRVGLDSPRLDSPHAAHLFFGMVNLLVALLNSWIGASIVLSYIAALRTMEPGSDLGYLLYAVLGLAVIYTFLNLGFMLAGGLLLVSHEWSRRYCVGCGYFHLALYGFLFAFAVMGSHTGQSLHLQEPTIRMFVFIGLSMAYIAVMIFALTRPMVMYTTRR